MKPIIGIYGLVCFLCGIIMGCSNGDTAKAAETLSLEKPDPDITNTPTNPPPKIQYYWGSQIDDIEGCEYIKWYFSDGNFTYIHKGNCKSCRTQTVNLPVDNQLAKASITNFYKTFTKDGCEYAICYGAAVSYTHIGTCTNCWQRMEAMIRRIIKEGKEEKSQ